MGKCKITIKNNVAYITGDYDTEVVKNVTSYPVAGAFFSPLFKRKLWDGRSHTFSKKTKSFPFGLTNVVVEALNGVGTEVEVVDETEWPEVSNNGFDLHTIEFGKGRYDYQLEAAKTFVEKRRGILKIATNGGKSAIAAAITHHLNIPTLFIVPGIDLLYQTRAMFAKYLDVDVETLGIIGDGNCVYGDWITFAVIDSLASKVDNEDEEFLKIKDTWQLLFTDEAHTSASETAFSTLSKIPAPYRCGISGTPYSRSDGASLRLTGQTGDIIYEIKNKTLVERGISVQPHLHILTHKEPILPKGSAWATVLDRGIVNNESLNRKLVYYAHEHIKEGAQCIFMVDKIAQGNNILRIINSLKPDYECFFMRGDLSSDERKQCLADFSSGKIRVIIGTSVMSTGIDLSNIDMVVLCGGGKATIPQLQRIGRGLRSGRGRDKCIIVDFMSFSHKHLIKHSQARLKTYKEEDCFNISVVD